MKTPPKLFSTGQTVYYPALALGHDGTVSRCEVVELVVSRYHPNYPNYASKGEARYTCHRPGKAYWKAHKPESLFATPSEALARLKEKLQQRIGKLSEALESLDGGAPYILIGHNGTRKIVTHEEAKELEQKLVKAFGGCERTHTSSRGFKLEAGGYEYHLYPVAKNV